MVVNGWLDPLGGHAWNYVNCDGKWYVSDPTNKRNFDIDEIKRVKGISERDAKNIRDYFDSKEGK